MKMGICKSFITHWIISSIVGIIFILEICFLNDLTELGGRMLTLGADTITTSTDTQLPQDRRKTAPEIRKYIQVKKIEATQDPYLVVLSGIVPDNISFKPNWFKNGIEPRADTSYNHIGEMRKFKKDTHGPPEKIIG